MTQPSPTPVPDHGTGWGLLLLFSYLYVSVGILGVLTMSAFALRYFVRRVPQGLTYFSVITLFGTLGVSLFILLVAASAQMYDIVGLLLLVVFVPLVYVVVRRRERDGSRFAIIAQAGMVWSIPFLVGFGVIAFVGILASNIPPTVTGLTAVSIVVGGTVILERRPEFSLVE